MITKKSEKGFAKRERRVRVPRRTLIECTKIRDSHGGAEKTNNRIAFEVDESATSIRAFFNEEHATPTIQKKIIKWCEKNKIK